MKYLPLAILAVALPAWANGPKTTPQAEANAEAYASADGGSVGPVSTGTLSNSVRAFSLSGPVTQVQAADCWVPGKGRKRSWSILWGLVSVSGTLERDEDCWAEYVRQQAFARSKVEQELSQRRAAEQPELAK